MGDLIYSDKILMTVICIIVDIVYIYTLYTQNLNTFDRYYIITSIILHTIFYIYLWNYNKQVIYILHLLMIPLFLSCLVIKNRYILNTLLFILISMLCMWLVLRRCPLNEKNEHLFGGPTTITAIINYIGTFCLLLVLIYKVFNNKLQSKTT
jgi:hypothetical protein